MNERNQNDCGDNNIQGKESTDAIRKKIAQEQRHIQRVMLDDPGNELRIRQK